MTDVLTPQQRAIVDLADRGYPAPQIAKHLGIAPSLVPDQIHLAEKKGVKVNLLSAHEAKRRINHEEAKRIAREAR